MPFSDFTKAVNFFVVGSFTVAVMTLWIWAFNAPAVVEFLSRGPAQSVPAAQVNVSGTTSGPLLAFSSGLALIIVTFLLPLSLFVGMLVEGMASYSRFISAAIIERMMRGKRSARILEYACLALGVRHSLRHMQAARRQFVSLVEPTQDRQLTEGNSPEQNPDSRDDDVAESRLYMQAGDLEFKMNLEKRYRILATGIALKESSKEAFTWMTSHYSTYILCTNCALVAFPAVILFAKLANLPLAQFLALPVSVLFIHVALDRRLYTYELAYSQAFTHLALKGEEDLEAFIKRAGF